MVSKDNKITIDLTPLMQTLGYQFKNIDLLRQALRHRSVGNENNERLEFLGDAVLSYIIANEVYLRQPKATEGKLSRMRSALVNGEVIAEMAKDLTINDYLELGAGELKSGGRERESILADAFEAVIGAMYLDGGVVQVQQCVLQWYGERFSDLSKFKPSKDPKSALQEWLQARKLPLPTYEAKTTGAAHAQTFHVSCIVEGFDLVTKGQSTSRRKAEQIAAAKFMDAIDE